MISNARKIFLFICLLFSVFHFIGQDFPPIKNYSPVDYQAGNQNWAISQSVEKNIYVANHSGLLEFNGAFWKLYPTPNGSVMRSVSVINDIIYTGCYMEIGYWVKNEFGNLTYKSLLPKTPVPLIEDEQFWNVLGYDRWVLFQSLDRIYIYNTSEESFTIIDSKSKRAKLFVVNNEVYFQKDNDGVYKIENGAAELVFKYPEFSNNLVVGMFLIDQELLFIMEDGHFFKWSNNKLSSWEIAASQELTKEGIFSSLHLKDGGFILGTISNGIFHIDSKGTVQNRINKAKGLNNNTILSLYEDAEQNIWLGLDNGLSVINLNSPFRVYNDSDGTVGTVYASTIYKGYLYLGTNQGLFYKMAKTDDRFEFIENTRGQVWCLRVFDDALFCGHHKGTFIINNNIAEKISEIEGTWDIQEVKNESNILIQGNYTGLHVLDKISGSWRFRNKIEGIDISSRSFEILNPNDLLLNHEYKGVFKLTFDDSFEKVIKTERKGEKNTGSSLVTYNNNIYLNSANNILRYNSKKQEFVRDSIFSKIFFNNDDPIYGQLVSRSETNKLWGFSNNNIICVKPGKLDKTPHITHIPVPQFFRRSLGIASYETINHLENESYIIGSANGYTIVDLNKINKNDHSISINTVYVNDKGGPKKQLSAVEEITLNSGENNISFTYSVPIFDKYTDVMYQYKLEGLKEAQWSNWSNNPKTTLSKLRFGDYNFMVKALIGNTTSTNVDSFSFKIKRPWYLSNWMILLYIILGSGFLFLIHLFNRRHFRQQQQILIKKQERDIVLTKLENDKELMEIKNQQLKNDIVNKNRELTITSMSIIKKNKILNRIKKELIEENSFTKKDKVIKTIDNNIKSNKDWEFLEEALNNADKDFFKKIKKIHPILTPNDLRFCAYLRLNLSSKEIAPLLNISVRSVEIKRYRLRKKMELPHEGSLIDYILSI